MYTDNEVEQDSRPLHVVSDPLQSIYLLPFPDGHDIIENAEPYYDDDRPEFITDGVYDRESEQQYMSDADSGLYAALEF